MSAAGDEFEAPVPDQSHQTDATWLLRLFEARFVGRVTTGVGEENEE
jgi:hypothetical protein